MNLERRVDIFDDLDAWSREKRLSLLLVFQFYWLGGDVSIALSIFAGERHFQDPV